jgi:hypothetical protein
MYTIFFMWLTTRKGYESGQALVYAWHVHTDFVMYVVRRGRVSIMYGPVVASTCPGGLSAVQACVVCRLLPPAASLMGLLMRSRCGGHYGTTLHKKQDSNAIKLFIHI